MSEVQVFLDSHVDLFDINMFWAISAKRFLHPLLGIQKGCVNGSPDPDAPWHVGFGAVTCPMITLLGSQGCGQCILFPLSITAMEYKLF